MNWGKDPVIFQRKFRVESKCPYTLSSLTRSPLVQMTPYQEQKVPFFQELRMPEGSGVIPDLKAKRPASSSGWHVAALVELKHRRKILAPKMKKVKEQELVVLCVVW